MSHESKKTKVPFEDIYTKTRMFRTGQTEEVENETENDINIVPFHVLSSKDHENKLFSEIITKSHQINKSEVIKCESNKKETVNRVAPIPNPRKNIVSKTKPPIPAKPAKILTLNNNKISSSKPSGLTSYIKSTEDNLESKTNINPDSSTSDPNISRNNQTYFGSDDIIKHNIEAAKCIELAKRAIYIGDYEEAERFVGKAIGMNDTEEARELLARIIIGKTLIGACNTTENKKSDKQHKIPDKQNDINTVTIRDRREPKEYKLDENNVQNREESKKCIIVAKEAINNKDYVKAQRFLIKAKRMNSTEDTEIYLKLVEDALSWKKLSSGMGK